MWMYVCERVGLCVNVCMGVCVHGCECMCVDVWVFGCVRVSAGVDVWV